MPQDIPPQNIPIEASEVLVFTPPSLADLPDPPRLRLRAATWREKRAVRKLTDDEGIQFHATTALRDGARVGLKEKWGEESYEVHIARVEAWWDANDALETARLSDPDAALEFDADEARAVAELLDLLEKAHRPLARMISDNSDFFEMRYPLLVAVTVIDWTGLDVPRRMEGGYLDLGCAMALFEALHGAARAAGLPVPHLPFLELGSACHDRLYLSEHVAKNSASLLPSGTLPEVSSNSAAPGSSPESTAPTASRKRSNKTPASA